MSKRMCSDVIAIERAHLDLKGMMKGGCEYIGGFGQWIFCTV